jgi:hypothetical protein
MLRLGNIMLYVVDTFPRTEKPYSWNIVANHGKTITFPSGFSTTPSRKQINGPQTLLITHYLTARVSKIFDVLVVSAAIYDCCNYNINGCYKSVYQSFLSSIIIFLFVNFPYILSFRSRY